jgi:hypothetical protein
MKLPINSYLLQYRQPIFLGIATIVFLGASIWLVIEYLPSTVVETVENQEVLPAKTTDPVNEKLTTILQFHWQTDAQQVYEYHAYTEVDTNTTLGIDGGDNWQTVAIEIKGILNVRVFGELDDLIYLGFQLSPVQLFTQKQRIPNIEKIFEQRFFMAAFTPTGKPQQFFFPQGLQASDRQSLINFINGMQIYLPDQSTKTWETAEKDITGEYYAKYHLDQQLKYSVRKQKTNYFKVHAKEQVIGQVPATSGRSPLNIQVVHSDFLATVTPNHAWFEKMVNHEQLELRIGQQLATKTRNELTVTLSNQPIDMTLAIWQADDDPQKVIHAFNQDTTKRTAVAELQEQQREAQLKAQFSQVRVVDLMKPIAAFDLKNKSMSEILPAMRELENYLSVYPEAATDLRAMLQQQPLSGGNSALLVGVLTSVGHFEAQAALSELILNADASINQQVAHQALFGATQVEKIEPLLVDTLRTAAQREDENAGMALLVMGAVSHKLIADNPDEAIALREEIMSYLQEQTTPDKQETALRALSNAKASEAEMAEVVTPYLETEHENVRAVAYGVLRHFNDQASLNHLITGATTDESNYVRRKAVEALSVRKDASEALIPVSQQLAQESNDRVRQTIIGFLGKNKTNHPQVVETLQQQLTLETSREMKKEVYKALYSK